MKPFARTARRGLGWLVFAAGNLAALALLTESQQLGHWLAH